MSGRASECVAFIPNELKNISAFICGHWIIQLKMASMANFWWVTLWYRNTWKGHNENSILNGILHIWEQLWSISHHKTIDRGQCRMNLHLKSERFRKHEQFSSTHPSTWATIYFSRWPTNQKHGINKMFTDFRCTQRLWHGFTGKKRGWNWRQQTSVLSSFLRWPHNTSSHDGPDKWRQVTCWRCDYPRNAIKAHNHSGPCF